MPDAIATTKTTISIPEYEEKLDDLAITVAALVERVESLEVRLTAHGWTKDEVGAR